MTTTDILNTIRKRIDAATPGPWHSGSWSGQCHIKHPHGVGACKYEYTLDREFKNSIVSNFNSRHINVVTTTDEYGAMADVDSEFIASSRTDLDKLEKALRMVIVKLERNNIVAEQALSQIEVILNDH